jgi:hypothetical protein
MAQFRPFDDGSKMHSSQIRFLSLLQCECAFLQLYCYQRLHLNFFEKRISRKAVLLKIQIFSSYTHLCIKKSFLYSVIQKSFRLGFKYYCNRIM